MSLVFVFVAIVIWALLCAKALRNRRLRHRHSHFAIICCGPVLLLEECCCRKHEEGLLGSNNSRTLYHVTTPHNAECILRYGFMCGSQGLAGGGIYFAETQSDANRKAHRNGALLRCQVDLGRQLAISSSGDSQAQQKMIDGGYQSVTIPRNGTEHVVYDPRRVTSVVRLY